jgi:hypothetical protein
LISIGHDECLLFQNSFGEWAIFGENHIISDFEREETNWERTYLAPLEEKLNYYPFGTDGYDIALAEYEDMYLSRHGDQRNGPNEKEHQKILRRRTFIPKWFASHKPPVPPNVSTLAIPDQYYASDSFMTSLAVSCYFHDTSCPFLLSWEFVPNSEVDNPLLRYHNDPNVDINNSRLIRPSGFLFQIFQWIQEVNPRLRPQFVHRYDEIAGYYLEDFAQSVPKPLTRLIVWNYLDYQETMKNYVSDVRAAISFQSAESKKSKDSPPTIVECDEDDGRTSSTVRSSIADIEDDMEEDD